MKGNDRMADTFDITKKPYFDIQDTIAEVGISRRQLSHWENQGLFEAEMGESAKKYTIEDIQRLKALRTMNTKWFKR